MSQLAQLFEVDRDRLPALVEAATPTLHATARELDGFEWSGYYFVVLLSYLGEAGIPLMSSDADEAAIALGAAQGMSAFIFTSAHQTYIPQLDPEAHDVEELRRYFEELNEYEDPEAGRAMGDALAALRRHIGGLDDSTVLLLTVG